MKNKVITAAVLFLMVVTNALATGDKSKDKSKSADSTAPVSITGTVTDKTTGESLAGVLVKVNETGTVVYSDFEGNFEVSVLPGDYTLTTTLISYETAKINMTASSSQKNLTVSLDNLSKKK
jgi:hypothetical protein